LTPVLSNVRSSSELAGAWFVHSGIQDETGGVARYYRSDAAQNARVSTEITGYAVSTLLYLYGRTENADYLAAAERAGKFLVEVAWSPRLTTFPFEHSLRDAPRPLAYFFDCGIIIRGLVRLAEITGESSYLDIAIKAGRSLASDFAAPTGYHPIIELPGKSPVEYTPQWSRSPGCYQLKSALSWHDLARVTGNTEFHALYESAVAAAIKAKDSFLPGETPEATMDRLHAYAYFLEGMLPLAGRSDCAAAVAEGIQRISNYLRSIRPVFERSDVYAQLLRARLFANQLAGIPVNRSAAEDELAQIVDFQLAGDDPKVRGGFCFGRKGDKMLPYVNPVSAAFCLQALEMWNDFESGKNLDVATLI
jgi:uncharacterized protein YyaL (SSP411 family)